MVKVVKIGLVYRMKYNHQCGIMTLKLLQQKKYLFCDINHNLDNVGPICITSILLYYKGEDLEQVDEYIYLGQLIKLKKDLDNEIKRRIKIGWMTFGRNRDIFKSKMPLCLKRKIYNQCVIPAMTYGYETWELTKQV